jgi:hypothetical protein
MQSSNLAGIFVTQHPFLAYKAGHIFRSKVGQF